MMVAYFLSGLARKEELVGDVDDDDDDDENNNKDGADDVAAAAAPMPRTPTTRDLVGRRESIILTVGKENTAVYSMSAFKTTVRGVIMVLRVENSASSVKVRIKNWRESVLEGTWVWTLDAQKVGQRGLGLVGQYYDLITLVIIGPDPRYLPSSLKIIPNTCNISQLRRISEMPH